MTTMYSENKKIGQKIRKARLANNLTQNQLGKTIGVTGSAVGYLEAGLRKISPDVLKKIADTLNKPFKYFFESEDENYSVYEKMRGLEKHFKELFSAVKRTEREKFGFKEFYESMIDEIPLIIMFFNEENKLSFANKKGIIFFNIAKDKKSAQKLNNNLKSIIKKYQPEIIKNTIFNFSLDKDNNFQAKSVYEKNSKYLGLWIIEEAKK